MMTTEEYAYARARARRPVKVTLPSPLMLFLVWSPQRSRDAYPDPFEMFADGLRLMKEEAEELARMGCRYIQVDAPDFGQLVDPAQREAWEQADQLAARISEASGFFPLEQLALSTQCGFASAGPGNQISEDAQENKLRLVGEVADRVWG
jgi:methionine synthase II (cobalamin-independent)